MLLLGEIHGTVEVPELVGDLVCAAAARDLPVLLGLEIPEFEQSSLRRFVYGEINECELTAGRFWTRPFQDGRSSTAMADLLTRARDLRSRGASIEILAFDSWDDPNHRDRSMAESVLRELRTRKHHVAIILAGNLHTPTAGAGDGDGDPPMGVYVRRTHADTLSVRIDFAGGSAWICTETCGPQPLGAEGAEGRTLVLHDGPDASGVDGVIHIGAATAAPPAERDHCH